MKKAVTALPAAALALALTACGSGASSSPSPQNAPSPTPESTVSAEPDESLPSGSGSDLYSLASADAESTISGLAAEQQALAAEIATYDDYVANADRVTAFYQTVAEETRGLCIRLREYGADYTDSVLGSGLSCDEMYDELDALFDDLYDDVGDDVFDALYDDLMDDAYDAFYGGVLS